MHRSMLLSLLYVEAASAAASGIRLEATDGQTLAICQPSFAWMENSEQNSPCQVAASVDALCNNGQWFIGALNASVTYTNPVNETANLCTCSWASYNLLNACVVCQGFPEQIPQWTVFKSGCTPAELSDIFFPEALTLPSDVAIPAWAQQDPTQWTNEIFNVIQAQTIEQTHQPDFVQPNPVGGTSTGAHTETNIVVIVGAVIGGVVVITGGVIIALWMIRRQRKSMAASVTSASSPSGHVHFMLDPSTAPNWNHPNNHASLSASANRPNHAKRSVISPIRSWYDPSFTPALRSAQRHKAQVHYK